MPPERTAREIYSEILDIQMACHPPVNKDRVVQKLLEDYRQVSVSELHKALETQPFSLACSQCDVDGPAQYKEALAEGWLEIAPDDGLSWNFLGLCPDCSKEE